MQGRQVAQLAALVAMAAALAQAAPAVVILVRHAEQFKDAGDDPGLTPAGRQRAEDLTRVVATFQAAGGKVTALFASDRKRTQETVAPLQTARLKLRVLPARDTAAFAREILAVNGGIVVVAGHSNTVPAILEALGGPAKITIDEADFDRLFVLTGLARKTAMVEMLYGK